MNILPRIEARKYATGAEIIAEAMRRKARLATIPKLEKPTGYVAPKRKHMAKQCPLWEFEAINFEQHVVDYRRIYGLRSSAREALLGHMSAPGAKS
ncbi:hypothetical protein [Rhizobium johnstonii]|uniref:hypothetical protein n=1 Tax=Rhizobium johnstonii TaxID=3019933 RepID=UPI002FF0E7FE